ncbi:MAG: MTH938/NDUFAF3 family protein [Gammaproteobacteria bacterium]
MQLERVLSHTKANLKTIQSYCPKQGLLIEGQWYKNNVLLNGNQMIEHWKFSETALLNFCIQQSHKPEVVILGVEQPYSKTENALDHARLLCLLNQAGIGLEIMPIHSACFTYTMLLGDLRPCIALFLF